MKKMFMMAVIGISLLTRLEYLNRTADATTINYLDKTNTLSPGAIHQLYHVSDKLNDILFFFN